MNRLARCTPEALANLAAANGLVVQPHPCGVAFVVVASVLHYAVEPKPVGEWRWEVAS